jgi:hypothetical protein
MTALAEVISTDYTSVITENGQVLYRLGLGMTTVLLYMYTGLGLDSCGHFVGTSCSLPIFGPFKAPWLGISA